MTQVHNSEVILELRNAAKLQPGRDNIPNFLSSGIMPTIELNPKLVKNAFFKSNVSANLNGNATIYSVPANQDFYLCSANLTMIKDVTADTVDAILNGTVGGAASSILVVPGITLTAQQQSVNITFPHPLKIDKGTNIIINASRSVGANRIAASISGFLDETSSA